jgi:integrase
MSKADSTPSSGAGKPNKSAKPAKPYPDFPLFPHAAGVWAKKIRGKMHYFGGWDDPDAALTNYLEKKDALHSGRKPRPNPGAVTVKDVANAFLNHKKDRLETGELSPLTWTNYKGAADTLVIHLGKTRLVADLAPQDFAALRNKMAKQWGAHRLAITIQYIRSIFKFAFEAGLIPTPVCFGAGFARPSQKTFRLLRAEQGPKLFAVDEIRRLIAAADAQLRAMLLLAINAGFGNSDCGRLPQTAVNLDTGWIDFPRPKTGIPRRCPLWPETVAALREAIAIRPDPNDPGDTGLVFLTPEGNPWGSGNGITRETRKLLRALGIDGRKGSKFYTLRHVFRTIADGAKDQPAADRIMGHEVAHMSSVYREGIHDARLKAVTDHVHGWLFPVV